MLFPICIIKKKKMLTDVGLWTRGNFYAGYKCLSTFQSSNFWVLVRALKEFVEHEGKGEYCGNFLNNL